MYYRGRFFILNILICDDNERDCRYLEQLLKNLLEKEHIQYVIDICGDKNSVLDRILKYDFLFLDIELQDENGIDIGICARKKHPDIHIILTSSFKKYLEAGYKTGANRYFIKPINPTLFETEMKELFTQDYDSELSFYDPEVIDMRIPYRDIMYIEYMDRTSFIHLNNNKIIKCKYKKYEWTDKLKNLPFGQSYKSFIVNYKYVAELVKRDILLITDEKVPISKHYREDFENGYVQYIRRSL